MVTLTKLKVLLYVNVKYKIRKFSGKAEKTLPPPKEVDF